jgi:acyl-CoA thioesterase I
MNERRLLSCALLLAACGRDASPPASPPEVPRAAALKVIAFGDSLTAGKDLEDPDKEAYPAVLETLLREAGFDAAVVNAGVSGDTTADALARLDWSLEGGADVVLVALGSNDTFQGKKLEDVERNLSEILKRVRAKGAVPVLAAMKTFPNLGPYYGAAYEKLFPRVAAREGAAAAPFMLEGVAGDPSLNLADGIHPNAAGHRRVARNLLPAVETALRKAPRRPI